MIFPVSHRAARGACPALRGAWRAMTQLAITGLTIATFLGCQKKPNTENPNNPPVTPPQVQTPGGPYEQAMHRPVLQTISIAVVFKNNDQDAYRDAFRRGAEAAAKEIGMMTLDFKEPAQPTVAAQMEILQRLRILGTNLILLEAADPFTICPIVRKLRLEELQVVTFGSDCSAEKSHRLFWVSPVPTVATGRLLADLAAREAGKEGELAIISAGANDIQPKRLLQAIQYQLATSYPQLKLTTVKYTNDDPIRAKVLTQEILNENPGVKILLVLSQHVLPAVASAVEEAKAQNRLAIIGIGTPKSARAFVHNGVIRDLVTWNPEDYGYFAAYIARMVMDRKLSFNSRYKIGRIGYVVMEGDELPMAEPIVVTAETVDAYNF